jgi:hypothetical protein
MAIIISDLGLRDERGRELKELTTVLSFLPSAF